MNKIEFQNKGNLFTSETAIVRMDERPHRGAGDVSEKKNSLYLHLYEISGFINFE